MRLGPLADLTKKTKVAIQAHIVLVPIDVKSPSVDYACLAGAKYNLQRYGMPTLGLSFVSQQSVRVIRNSSL